MAEDNSPPATASLPPVVRREEVSASEFRVTGELVPQMEIRHEISSVAFRKPNSTEFIRTNGNPAFTSVYPILQLKDSISDFWLIAPHLADEFPELVRYHRVYVCCNSTNKIFLCGVQLADPRTGKRNKWHESLEYELSIANFSWIRLEADTSSSGYQHTISSSTKEPVFPERYSLDNLMDIAFRGRKITSIDHDVLRRLRGELL